jgi:hypothetical protein
MLTRGICFLIYFFKASVPAEVRPVQGLFIFHATSQCTRDGHSDKLHNCRGLPPAGGLLMLIEEVIEFFRKVPPFQFLDEPTLKSITSGISLEF